MEAVTSEPSALLVCCVWCGKMYEQHLNAHRPGAPVPRVPCQLLKSGFQARRET